MAEVFTKILNMSLTAGYCIAAVIVLRFLLRRQAKIFSYLLWSVVLFRLLCPFSIISSYSLLRMDPQVVSGNAFSGGQQVVWQGKGYDGAMEAVPFASSTEDGSWDQAERWQKTIMIAAWVWLAGIGMLLGYSLWSMFGLRHFLSKAVLLDKGVYEAEGISTPFIFGIVRPKIYLPPCLQPEERRYVLAHERIHIRRKDYLLKLISWCAVCLHWFNPLVWIAFVLMERDMEMSCDEAVLRSMGEDVKEAYSFTLLQLSSAESTVGSSPIAFGEGNVKSRIQNILGWHKRRIVTVVSLAVLLGILVFGLALNPVASANREQREAEEELRRDFVTAYANAFCERDGNTLVGMYANKWRAYESLPYLEKAGGTYTFGMSSPWPNEFRYILTENLTKKEKAGEGSAEIWYYAWTSDPHVTVWKEYLQFEETAEGCRVTGSSLYYLDSITSREEFDEAYWIGGEYQFTDYVERGFLEGILAQTAYDKENGDADRNAVYRNPDTAAAWIFNLEGGRCETLSNVSGMQATVEYTFADGSSVQIPMYNVTYNGMTIEREEPEEGMQVTVQVTEDVWLPDLHVWNAGAP